MSQESPTSGQAPLSQAQSSQAQLSQAQPPQAPKVIDTSAVTHYANFCRVTGTPEELLIDFGLHAQARPTDDQPVHIAQRVVLNYYTAKRLLQALGLTIARHEQAFGPLETNVQKRLEKK